MAPKPESAKSESILSPKPEAFKNKPKNPKPLNLHVLNEIVLKSSPLPQTPIDPCKPCFVSASSVRKPPQDPALAPEASSRSPNSYTPKP